jgi:hypothetical protein
MSHQCRWLGRRDAATLFLHATSAPLANSREYLHHLLVWCHIYGAEIFKGGDGSSATVSTSEDTQAGHAEI